ncbi:MAG: pyridoxal phosphate-dependent aminotransferase [Thermodesulfobacteriota bacterium]
MKPMLSRRVPAPESPNRLMTAFRNLSSSGHRLIHLVETNPTRCGFSYDDDAIRRAAADIGILHYRPNPKGSLEARSAIQTYYRDWGVNVDPDRILLTSSTSEAYSFLFKLLCDPGDQVLVPKPSYPLFDVLARLDDVSLAGYSLIHRPETGWRIDIDSLYDAIGHRCRAVILVHPNNPTGSYIRPAELDILEAHCERFGLSLIIDEVFLDFGAIGKGTPPERSCAGRNRVPTFILSGLSKICGLPQLKLGWIVVSGPPDLSDELTERLEWISDAYLSVSASAQAAAALIQHRQHFQRQVRSRIEENLQTIADEGLAPLRGNLYEREGGWYALIRLASTLSDEELACRLLEEERVFVHPGYFYDIEADEPVIVLSLLCDPKAFREGVRRLVRFLGSIGGR